MKNFSQGAVRMARPAPVGIATAALLLSLAGCGSIGEMVSGDKINYKSAGAVKAAPLDVPPDLTQLSKDSRYMLPSAAVTANSYQSGQAVSAGAAAPTAAAAVGDVRVERSGNQRWLVVKRPADKLWDPVREFWKDSGFQLVIEQENLGILETDFAENRAKLPQDFIRNTLGKVLDNFYSTGERDKFRTRLERLPDGSTEIYISHRGMVETVTEGARGSTMWQPRPADRELEAEFLRRLMLKLGVTQQQSQSLIAAAPKAGARATMVNNQPAVQIDDNFERAWRRVGLALDRTGFTVEDRDRAQGLYFVRYVDPNTDKKDAGFFSNLFSKTASSGPIKYRIVVRGQGESSTVSVFNAEGAPEASANAQRIVQVIADDLK